MDYLQAPSLQESSCIFRIFIHEKSCPSGTYDCYSGVDHRFNDCLELPYLPHQLRCVMRSRVRYFSADLHSQLAGAFSGMLAAAIETMNGIGGRPGWAWIFIIVCFTNFFSICCNFQSLPNHFPRKDCFQLSSALLVSSLCLLHHAIPSF